MSAGTPGGRRVAKPSKSSERVRVEKARLRIVLDRRLGRETSPHVKELARKKV